MSNKNVNTSNRRHFLKQTGTIAAASTLVAAAQTPVHAAEDNTIQLALVGCGGRGTGAAMNALSVRNGPTKLVAMADVFEDRLKISHRSLSTQKVNEVVVPEDRKFIGFDAYKKAIDCLKPGDVAIFATPPAFRWVHFTYAIEKGVNVFMEKPVTVDGPTSRRMFELAKKSQAKNLKVAVGLMCRHCKARQALADKIHNGDLGDILILRAYRMAGPTGSAATGPAPKGMSELEWQIRRFHAFLWASGGAVSDFLIHNIDEGCWAKGAWPVKAIASGGRHYRADTIDQNFDTYSIEYTFGDGTKLLVNGRTIPGCKSDFATYVHGTKGSAIFSTRGHIPAKSRVFKGQNFVKDDLVWHYPNREPNPYQEEWEDLIQAIRDDADYNEVERGVQASLVTSMGRMAAHTGQEITYDQMLNCEHEFAPNVNKLKLDGPAPLLADNNGKYPIPLPGLVADVEYET
ncbi:MAG: Gfo/Idh/MocA family oxidoreductase [Planctomycetes bacterium]|nr:Gfo/Idh/MocA family oxidoreductase [Planctomycetota bacterium]